MPTREELRSMLRDIIKAKCLTRGPKGKSVVKNIEDMQLSHQEKGEDFKKN